MMRELTGGCVRWPRDLAPDKLALFFERPDLEACQSHFSLAAKREVHRIMYSVNETNYHVTHAAVCCCLHCLSFKGSTLGVVVVNISAADGLTPCMPPTQNVIIARLSCTCVLGPWSSAHVISRRQKARAQHSMALRKPRFIRTLASPLCGVLDTGQQKKFLEFTRQIASRCAPSTLRRCWFEDGRK
jgi:hypothetical protein